MRDRLTTRLANGGVGYDNGEYFKVCYPCDEHCLTDIDRMAIKLCDLEDKIEQGKILELPCAVGSQIYFADHENKSVWAGNVVSFSLDAAHLWFNCHYKCGLNMWHPIEDFGKTVFLTREEAERALERSENGKS